MEGGTRNMVEIFRVLSSSVGEKDEWGKGRVVRRGTVVRL